jgi:hypothetical protein
MELPSLSTALSLGRTIWGSFRGWYAKPRIRSGGLSLTEPIGVVWQNQIIGQARFLNLKVRNNPKKPWPEAVARDVHAEIEIRDNNGQLLIGPIAGRWADSDQPSEDWRKSTKPLEQVDIGLGVSRELGVLMQHPGGPIYVINNESWKYPRLAKPEFEIRTDSFKVRIRLIGIHVDEVFSYHLRGDSL